MNDGTDHEPRQDEILRQPEALDKYQKSIAKGLDKALTDKRTDERQLELSTAKVIIFSDHHKGARDGADDFQRCERAYNAALAYYLETGHRLVVLGDVEELWECKPKEVLEAYPETLKLEAQFLKDDRYDRFWGNHDDQWRHEGQVSKLLRKHLDGSSLQVREALKLRVVDRGAPAGLLFLVHGHQGTLDSDRFRWFSRLFVRYAWRPLQRRLKISSTTPATSFDLRDRHNVAMFSWARGRREKPVLIAGHTHKPVFLKTGKDRPDPKVGDLQRELDALRASGTATSEKVAELRARIELLRADERQRNQQPPLKLDPPCYFNTGCCCFGDGDVTGIEIIGGEIRLVRWPDDDDKPLPKILAHTNLKAVLAACQGK